jgi:hypothetical protein
MRWREIEDDIVELYSHIRLTEEKLPMFESLYRELEEPIFLGSEHTGDTYRFD